jgi:hypothetical protein
MGSVAQSRLAVLRISLARYELRRQAVSEAKDDIVFIDIEEKDN